MAQQAGLVAINREKVCAVLQESLLEMALLT